MFIARKHQKSIGIMVNNQSKDIVQITQGQHLGTIHLVEGRAPSEEEAQEIIHQMKVSPQNISKVRSSSPDDFITNNNQVQIIRPVQYLDNTKLSPETKKELDKIIHKYSDIFSKYQYDFGTSTHPLVEIPTEGPPCIISVPYTIPLNFRPWADNTTN